MLTFCLLCIMFIFMGFMMSKKSYFLGFMFIFGLIFTGCVKNNNSNNDIKINPKTSPELNKLLNEYVNSNAKKNYFSAISATVRCGNNQVSGVAGTMQRDNTTLVDTNSLFQIGSTTKSFISVVILQLANNPKNNFSLNDTIGKWFKNLDGSPEYPQWQNITVIQLMNMSSGIPDYTNDTLENIEHSLMNPNDYFSPTKLVKSVENIPLFKGFHYSNTSYILLGMLIQKITGNSPILEIENRIFKKLNLTHTYFPEHLPLTIVPRNQMVNGYAYFDIFPDPYKHLNKFYNLTWNSMSLPYTAGGIISAPEDLMTYTHALYTPRKLLTANEIKDLTTKYMIAQSKTEGYPNGGQPISEVSQNIPVGYGLGVFNVYESGPLGSYYMYNGATLGFCSYYAYYPKSNMYLVFMINNSFNVRSCTDPKLVNEIKQYTLTNHCKK